MIELTDEQIEFLTANNTAYKTWLDPVKEVLWLTREDGGRMGWPAASIAVLSGGLGELIDTAFGIKEQRYIEREKRRVEAEQRRLANARASESVRMAYRLRRYPELRRYRMATTAARRSWGWSGLQ